jgi:hypothetical protein
MNLSSPDHLADADDDTKIQVEESVDEDKIRFDIAGTEFGHMDGKTFHLKTPGNSLFIGNNAGLLDDGSNNLNTFIGIGVGQANTIGFANTANGYRALYSNTIGNNNTALGHYADVSSIDLTNATAIGANAIVSQDSSLVLGHYAKVGIGISAPEAMLHVVGDIKIVDGNEATGYVLTSDDLGNIFQ